jgi:hypothetical protein
VISGTDFNIEAPQFVPRGCIGVPREVASPFEIGEIQAECEAKRALCLSCDDGMVVVGLEARDDRLELFVWIAVAFRHGAFMRQEAALRTIARDLGADTIAFRSRRRGWARRLGPEWARRGTEEFVRRVDG